jgi:hypothetical protein
MVMGDERNRWAPDGVQFPMIDRWHDPIQQWARDRGLDFLPDGLLPAWTRTLAPAPAPAATAPAL